MTIRRYLVLTLFSVLTLITFLAAIQGYKASMTRASVQYDQQLVILAQTLFLIQSSHKNTSSLTTILTENDDSFIFQVWQNNNLQLKTHSAPMLPMGLDNGMNETLNMPIESGFIDNNFQGERWRVYTLVQNEKNDIVVMVAQPLKKRFMLAQGIILAAVTPMVIAIVLLSFIIYGVITRGLKPLRSLVKALKAKEINDLKPLILMNDKNELEPVISTLNKLFSRLDSAFERERRFASDAAHELRTPLSVLKLNAHNVQLECGQEVESMNQLTQSVDRMVHVIDQILNLNRTNPEQIAIDCTKININTLIQCIIGELYSEIASRNQSIELNSDNITFTAHEFAIRLLVQNLISNASKYTPDGGEIMVITAVENNNLILTVVDSGPGIAESEYERVFDRFYRVGGDQHKSSVIGCGLGLAIVKHIATLHNATIILSRSEALKGLQVKVIFPLEQSCKNILLEKNH